MKIKDFLYIITIFVTAILAMMNSCNGGKLKKITLIYLKITHK